LPVSPTSNENILRISFSVRGELPVSTTTPMLHESEIVCFLRIGDTGLDITYSHHIIRVRDSTVGPFSREVERRMPLTPALVAVIELGVFYEFWTAFNRGVRTSPAPIGKLPTDQSEPLDPRLA
jgi:hypothetical protein